MEEVARSGNGAGNRVAAEVRRLAEGLVGGLGLEIVEVLVHGAGHHRIVRVDIDRAGPEGVNLEDCQAVSNALGDAIEAEELFDDRYTLEVSSPGLDRPIRTPEDVRRNTGRRIVVETRVPVDGKSRIRGVLEGLSDGNWVVCGDDGTRWLLAAESVARARQDRPF
jgi:ribosome maturation factor RimP